MGLLSWLFRRPRRAPSARPSGPGSPYRRPAPVRRPPEVQPKPAAAPPPPARSASSSPGFSIVFVALSVITSGVLAARRDHTPMSGPTPLEFKPIEYKPIDLRLQDFAELGGGWTELGADGLGVRAEPLFTAVERATTSAPSVTAPPKRAAPPPVASTAGSVVRSPMR